MKTTVVEITGYTSAISAMYMTNRNLTPDRQEDIQRTVNQATDRQGFILDNDATPYFLDYLNRTITYGLKHEHWQILKFIDVHILMEGLHRGAQDDYDAHAKRMEIIRATTRTAKGASFNEFSDYYKDKIMTFDAAYAHTHLNEEMPKGLTIDDKEWVKTPWGYVATEHANNPDACRGLTPLGIASNCLSKVPYGEHLQHIYDLRRSNPRGKPANPELQEAMEQLRADLQKKCPPLGYYLGKVWTPIGGGHYAERNECILADLADLKGYRHV